MKPRGSIISHLLAVIALFGALIGSAAATGYAALTRQDAAAKQLIGQYQVLQRAENDVQGSFNTAEFTLLLFSMTGEHGYFLPASLSRTEFDADVAVLRRRATPDLRGLIRTQASAGAAWFALAPRIGVGAPRQPAGRALLSSSFTQAIRVVSAGRAIQARLQADVARLTATSSAALRGGLEWGAAALAVAVLLMLIASLGMLRAVTRPLSLLTGTVRRLTAGEHAARATVTGSAEVRKVAQSVNALADESDRLRALEGKASGCARWHGRRGCGSGTTWSPTTCCTRRAGHLRAASMPTWCTCACWRTGGSARRSATKLAGTPRPTGSSGRPTPSTARSPGPGWGWPSSAPSWTTTAAP